MLLAALMAVPVVGLAAAPTAHAAPDCDVPNPPPVCEGPSVDPFKKFSPQGNFGVVARVAAPLQVRVGGTVSDPDAAGPGLVKIYSNNVYRGTVPSVNGGFKGIVPTAAGRQVFCAVAVNRGKGYDTKLRGCPSVDIATNPYGHVDVATAGPAGIRVAGWSIDPDTAASINVHVYVDDAGRSVPASVKRPDVGAAYPAYGAAHGFDVTVPAAKGARTVCVYGINTGPGSNTELGCTTVNQGGAPSRPAIGMDPSNRNAPRMTLNLRTSPDAATFTVYKGKPGQSSRPVVATLAAKAFEDVVWTDSAVTAGSTWCYSVVASNAYGPSPTMERCGTIPLPALRGVASLAVTRVSDHDLTLSWTDAAEGESEFIIESNGNTTHVPASPGTGKRLSRLITGLAPETEYCFTVYAYAKGHDHFTDRVCARTEATPAPDPEPTPPPIGISAVGLWNCEPHGYNGGLWMWDYTTGGGWRRIADAPNRPGCGGQASAVVSLPDGHIVMLALAIVREGCPYEDPGNLPIGCLRSNTNALLGDADGIVQRWYA